MAHRAPAVSTTRLYRLLQRCIKHRDLNEGRRVHDLIVKSGLESNVFLGNHLIRLYAVCGSLREAKEVFAQLPAPDNFVWAAIISAHDRNGRPDQAIRLYHQMHEFRARADDYVLVAALKACARACALAAGKLVHADARECGAESQVFVGNTLIHMYAKCGSLQDARRVFDHFQARDVVTWNAMIAGYAQQEEGEEAFRLFRRMHQEGLRPDKMTLASILKACSSMEAREEGQLIHAQIIHAGLESDVFVGSTLVDMYAKCGSLKDARSVFDRLVMRDLVTWTAMIAGYAQYGDGYDAIDLFHRMRSTGVQPNQLTLASVLKACSGVAALDQGKLLHSQIVESGFESNIYVGSTLVDMYAKCGSLEDARRVFDHMPSRNLVTWTAMISGYVQHGHGQEALDLFHEMNRSGMQPNQLTLISILRACSTSGCLDQGRLLQAYVIQHGFGSDIAIGSTLIDMYARCRSLEEARKVFDSLPSKSFVVWSTLIAGYALQDSSLEALHLFLQMQEQGIEADKVMLCSIVKACSSVGALDQGKLVHAHIIKSGLESDAFIGSSLVDFYVKCGSLDEARIVFDRLSTKDLVTWTALIGGYAHHGDGQEALNLFHRLQQNGMQPNEVTLVSLLKACATIAALDQGRQIHAQIIKHGCDSDVFVSSTLVDMYSKCGSLEDARKVFDQMPIKGLVSWNAMITGYAQHGLGRVVLKLFQQMQQEGVHPDSVTFIGLLCACSRAGLLEEGRLLFQSMSRDFGIIPEMEHYVCIVDLLGRSGRLHEATVFISLMPIQPDVVVWMSLLGACRMHGDVGLARKSFEAVLELDPRNAGAHVLMADVYAGAGKWADRGDVRKMMQTAGAKKECSRTWMECDHEVHSFGVEDMSHPDRKQIYASLQTLTRRIEQMYKDVDSNPTSDGEPKEINIDPLCTDIESLALALSLLNAPEKDSLSLWESC